MKIEEALKIADGGLYDWNHQGKFEALKSLAENYRKQQRILKTYQNILGDYAKKIKKDI